MDMGTLTGLVIAASEGIIEVDVTFQATDAQLAQGANSLRLITNKWLATTVVKDIGLYDEYAESLELEYEETGDEDIISLAINIKEGSPSWEEVHCEGFEENVSHAHLEDGVYTWHEVLSDNPATRGLLKYLEDFVGLLDREKADEVARTLQALEFFWI